ISCPWPRDWVSWIPKPWLAWLHSARKWGESSTASSTPSGTPRDAPKNCGRRPLLLKLRTPDSSLRTEPVGRGLSRWWEFYSDGLLVLPGRLHHRDVPHVLPLSFQIGQQAEGLDLQVGLAVLAGALDHHHAARHPHR